MRIRKCSCGKTRYKDAAHARKKLRGIKPVHEGAKVPVRAYLCNECGGWHITSLAREHLRERR